jgi:hypothetical protein
MTTTNLGDRCTVVATAQPLKLTLPGGAVLEASAGLEKGAAIAIVRPFLANITSSLAFMAPAFTALEVGTAALKAIAAVPKLIVKPQDLLSALADLAQAAPKVLALAPQFTVPPLVRDVLRVVATSLRAITDELTAFTEQQAEIDAAATLAAELDLPQLTASIECASGELAAAQSNLMASLGPLSKLLDFLRALVALLPVPIEIPTLDNLGENAQDILSSLTTLADTLDQIADVIPG